MKNAYFEKSLSYGESSKSLVHSVLPGKYAARLTKLVERDELPGDLISLDSSGSDSSAGFL